MIQSKSHADSIVHWISCFLGGREWDFMIYKISGALRYDASPNGWFSITCNKYHMIIGQPFPTENILIEPLESQHSLSRWAFLMNQHKSNSRSQQLKVSTGEEKWLFQFLNLQKERCVHATSFFNLRFSSFSIWWTSTMRHDENRH